MKNFLLTSLSIAVFSLPCFGQQQLSLSENDIALLELQFAPVEFADEQLGIELPGLVVTSPNIKAEVRSRFPGVLEHWNLQSGDVVAAGEVLAHIHSPEVLSLQQDYLVQYNSYALEQQRLQREQRLLDQGIISEQRFQQTEGQWRSVQLALNTLALKLQLAGMTESDLADLREGDLEIGLLLLRAPQSGLLAHRAFRVGEYVETNSVVATLNEPGNPWVSVQVPARLERFLEIGSPMRVSGSMHTLTLQQRDFEIDPTTQSIEVLAGFDSPESYVPGQLLTIALQPGQGALFVPSNAVVHEGSETLVYVRTPEGVEVRSLSLLPVGGGYLAGSGLNVDDEILIQGTALLKGIQMGLGSEQ